MTDSSANIQPIHHAADHIQQGRFEDAQQLLREILAADSSNVDALHLMGIACGSMGDLAEAVTHLNQAVASAPNFVAARYNLANALQLQERFAEAINHYRTILHAETDHTSARFNLMLALERVGEPDEAIEHADVLLALQLEDRELRRQVTCVLARAGQLDRAAEAMVAHTDVSVKRNVTADTWAQLGGLLFNQMMMEQSIECFQRALALDPQRVDLHHDLGQLLLAVGALEQAEDSLNKALALDNGHVHSRCAQALLRGRQGRFDEALTICDELSDKQADDELVQTTRDRICRQRDEQQSQFVMSTPAA